MPQSSRIGFVGLRPAKISLHSIASVPGDEAAVSLHGLRHGLEIGIYYPTQVFGIEPGAERRRPDQIAEHHGDLPPLGLERRDDWLSRRAHGIGGLIT